VVGDRIDPELRRRVRAGEYVVDPHAVAEAMLRRRDDRATARRLSRVLVAGQLDRLAAPADEPDARSGGD
jgi:hypothetical protein